MLECVDRVSSIENVGDGSRSTSALSLQGG
jgi:hypothetical protein